MPLRARIYEQSADVDPSLAEGMLAVRKDMTKAASEKRRMIVSRGIGGEPAYLLT